MKTWDIKFFVMGLILTHKNITAVTAKAAEREFKRLRGSYKIYKTLIVT